MHCLLHMYVLLLRHDPYAVIAWYMLWCGMVIVCLSLCYSGTLRWKVRA